LATLPHRSFTSSSESSGQALRPYELLVVVLLGICFYLAAFTFVIERPLTIDEIGAYIQYKVDYLASIRGQRKIAIFAGSNGRYSHRCETIAEQSGIACANLSSAAGFDLQWQMSRYWPYLERGDVLYMPLEYWPLLPPGAKIGSEAPYVVRRDHASLVMYSPSQLAFALFYFDIRYFFSGIGEMVLQRAGIQRRTSVRTMTAPGDERGATSAKAIAYRPYIQSLPAPSVNVDDYDDPVSNAAIASIIDTAKAKGIIVVGGLPTSFADGIVPAAVVDRLRALYEQHGACFLILPNHSQYPRSAFFDTEYHLQETAQIAHSAALAPRLAEISRAASCSALTPK
jgi:hypothetical protein